MKKKNYRIFEGLRVAATLTFISGYIDAFTFHTQGNRFAAVQTGNLIYFSLAIADQNWARALSYFVPIFIFSLGQFINYFMRKWTLKQGLNWHAFSSFIMLMILSVTAVLTQFLSPLFTIAGLTLFASIQVDTFKRLRGAPYANVMMTGNIKNAAQLLVKGWMEKNKDLRQEAYLIYAIMASFVLGIITSSFIASHFEEYALFFVLFPVLLVNYWLVNEKK